MLKRIGALMLMAPLLGNPEGLSKNVDQLPHQFDSVKPSTQFVLGEIIKARKGVLENINQTPAIKKVNDSNIAEHYTNIKKAAE